MKTCPYCAAENQDTAAVCYFCGNHLGTWTYSPGPAASGSGAEPTQPVHPRRPARQAPAAQPYDTQQIPRNPAPPLYPQSTAAYPPAYTPPPVYVPPPPPPPATSQPPNQFLPVLILALGAVLLLTCGFALWMFTSATNTAAERLRSQLATQAAGVFPPAAATPRSTEPQLPVEPTPWPTFTPQPQVEPTNPPDGATPTPDATQVVIIEKLLSEGCSNALDNLGRLSDQATSQPTVVFDAQWRESLNQAVADMKTNCGTLDAASPVPGLVSQAHQNLARAQSEFDQAGKLFDEGVRDLAPGKFLEAGQHVAEALKYLNQAMSDLRKIGN